MRRALLALGLLACDPTSKPTPAPAAPTTATATPPASSPVATPEPTPPMQPSPAPTSTPAAPDAVSNLKSDEDARVFPTVAHRDGDAWVIPLHAWVYEPEDGAVVRGAAIEALRAALELPPEAASSDIFRARAKPFLYDNESGKQLIVRVGDAAYTMPATGSNGHSQRTLIVPAEKFPAGWTTAAVVPRAGDDRKFGGDLLLLGDEGVSVVSDVDDTIKISEVRDKRKLLENTFMKPPVAVPGMAAAYARWAADGAAFHYVSASPWQLFDVLRGFFADAGYPRGSMHMKLFRWKDSSFWSLMQSPIEYKTPLIAALLTTFPKRRWVLVGDSGEKDPEVYGATYRAHPGQVVGIYIRDVTGEGRDAARYAAAFADVPADRWTIFTDPATLPARL